MKLVDAIHNGCHLPFPGWVPCLGVSGLAPNGGNQSLLPILGLAKNGRDGPAAVVGGELEHSW